MPYSENDDRRSISEMMEALDSELFPTGIFHGMKDSDDLSSADIPSRNKCLEDFAQLVTSLNSPAASEIAMSRLKLIICQSETHYQHSDPYVIMLLKQLSSVVERAASAIRAVGIDNAEVMAGIFTLFDGVKKSWLVNTASGAMTDIEHMIKSCADEQELIRVIELSRIIVQDGRPFIRNTNVLEILRHYPETLPVEWIPLDHHLRNPFPEI